MKNLLILVVLLVVAVLGGVVSAATEVAYAEDLRERAKYSAVFELAIDRQGNVKECTFAGMNELNENAKDVDVSASEGFVDDACRKLSSAKWVNAKGQITYYFCLFSEQNPDRAYCEEKFGR